MQRNWLKRVGWLGAIGAAAVAVAWFAWPRPIPVDTAQAARGPLAVTVDEEARTRVRHIYTVSAPVAGKVLRISRPDGHDGASLHIGDAVVEGRTTVAVMQPVPPGLLDVRSRAELEAALVAANAVVTLAEAEIHRIEAAVSFARTELARAEGLARSNTIPARDLEKARFDLETIEAQLATAKAQLEVRRREQAVASARLLESGTDAGTNQDCCVKVSAPESGRVLRIVQQDEAVVPVGAPLVQIGDPRDLEIVADFLSTEAVQIRSGAPVTIDGWGGPALRGRVVRVDPAGFAKVSALGIEEQRVGTVIDLVDPPESWERLGHDFRVIVHVAIWESNDALTVPASALFRRGDDWAVFAVKDGRAHATVVRTGQRNSKLVQVLSGLSPGDRVVLHPSDRVAEGTAVAEREPR
ncbi:efflux RND transporter periplasmic adaptor subunit [Ensifer adhaerens]|uniref:efflux RND transporter periplasmic adaptor subunit n=1 Tax=Ensifer adhaerens TaxID=106592 RepID=UPI001C4E01CD|nr:HlyD family efflux transporter periplasmic adaptor subunit [Ensifer adhaerens]MBW0366686.1 HlyD family efflux transporter periplasmic adaptor subunit [Ensifer adhaerens]UCM18370.1 HlyD family efflux transporter periplasmic adaptor subunit [Ensifer adhaerens]